MFASAAVNTTIAIERNQVGTRGSDSASELDDIDFEAQRKRLDLIEMRLAYQLAEKQLKSDNPSQLILMDTPLFISRDMVPLKQNTNHINEYNKTRQFIKNFWEKYRKQLFPWNQNGPVLASIVAERFSAIVSIAKQDLRKEDGRKHLLLADGVYSRKSCAINRTG